MSGTNPTAPRPMAGRRPSNPFTRNQDERDLAESSSPSPQVGSFPNSSSFIARFRNASIGSSNDDTIEEQDDEDIYPVPFRNNVSVPEHASLGSAKGGGTGVFEPSSKTPISSANPEGLSFRPTLRPAGGSQRQVATDDLEDPNKLYEKEQELDGLSGSSANRSSSADFFKQRGTGRSRGVVRTYSMAQQKRRPVIMNDDRIIRQRRLSHGQFSFYLGSIHLLTPLLISFRRRPRSTKTLHRRCRRDYASRLGARRYRWKLPDQHH